MTQHNNAPTMGKFSWKTASTGHAAGSGPTSSSNSGRTPRKRKDGEMAGGGETAAAATGGGGDSSREPKAGHPVADGKGSGLVGTGGARGADTSQGTVEEGEIVEEVNADAEGKAAPESGSPVRRSTRIHTRSEEELVSTDEGSTQGPTLSGKAPAHPPTMPTTSSPSPGEAKRVRIHTNSMHQCGVCGKMYKHRNCLTKHAWEHHESWALTKKWCQTKHQQVQMLEAAQVLTELTLLGGGESAPGSVVGSGASSGKASRKGTVSSF